MAGTLGAISSWAPKSPGLFLYNNDRIASGLFVLGICWHRLSVFFPFSRSLKMAPADQLNNSSPEIKEPCPKVPKLGQNGVHEVTQGPV